MTVTRLTVRALLLRRRAFALLLPILSVPLFAAIAILRGDTVPDSQAIIVGRLLVTTVAPLVALVLAATAVGDERETGTIAYLATARIARVRIVAEKALASTIVAAVLMIPAFVALAVLGAHLGVGAGNVLRGIAGTLLVTAAYAAAFTALGLVLRRALVAGIVYVLVWEGAIATVAPSAERVSLAAWGRAISDGGIVGLQPDLQPTLGGLAGAGVLLAVTAGAVALGAWRLTRMDLP